MQFSNILAGSAAEPNSNNNGVSSATNQSHQFEVEKNYFDSFRSGFNFNNRQANSLSNFMPDFVA